MLENGLLLLTRGGLLLDLVGAVLLLRGATPAEWKPDYAIIGPPGKLKPKEDKKHYEAKARIWARLSRWGIVFLAIGFALQFVGSFGS